MILISKHTTIGSEGYSIFGAASLSFGNEDKKIIITDDYEIVIERN